MTPHEFCHWLRGYLSADPSAANAHILRELVGVDMTSFFIPPIPDDDKSPPPSSPPAFSPRDPDGWETPYYWDSTTNSWRKLPPVHAQYYRDLTLSPPPN